MMEPFYQDESVTLYQGDALEILPYTRQATFVDAIVTDPPYGVTSLEWDCWPENWPAAMVGIAPQMWCFGSFRMFFDHASEFKGPWKIAQDIVWGKTQRQ
jgi:site-specific DNA-methyltransferase (adenine-specific)